MGTDIHCWIETRENDGAPWVIQRRSPCLTCEQKGKLPYGELAKSKWEECYRCGGLGYSELRVEDYEAARMSDGPFETTSRLIGGKAYRERNYVVFGLLAGVRSDREDVTFPPRGVPSDASPEYQELCRDEDGHSYSWLTLSEVEAAVMCAADPLATDREVYEQVAVNVRGEFWDGLVVGQLRPLAERCGGSENVRIVFFFDS